ncbi:DUF6355 family natural product biosynthesis protein [Saccharothrix sp. NPDC042600]|uniref:DUF6355 family natural product biosynthesis protein n=1 Tax=Saccharothrix TaxID=2071 RepID=UPI00340AD11D
MNRSIIARVLATLAITLGLALALGTGNANAQMAPAGSDTSTETQIQSRPHATEPPHSAPDAQIQGGPYGPHNGPNVDLNELSASDYRNCGFWVRWDSYYTHCGSAYSIKIRVNFWYGANFRDIWVSRGTTNLSTHPYLQGAGMITNAWCIERC